MTAKQLRAIRDRMGLTQAGLAVRLGMTASSVARMEQGVMIVTRSMELLIGYVAREAGVDVAAHTQRSRRVAKDKRAHIKASKTSAG
jgi:transcriptional regulator with XRE-family HTH domain